MLSTSTVLARIEKPDFYWVPQSPHIGDTVVFYDDTLFDGGEKLDHYCWDFNNDGEYDACGPNVHYLWLEGGNYHISYWVRGTYGNTASCDKWIFVTRSKSRISELPFFKFLEQFPLLQRLLELPIFNKLLSLN